MRSTGFRRPNPHILTADPDFRRFLSTDLHSVHNPWPQVADLSDRRTARQVYSQPLLNAWYLPTTDPSIIFCRPCDDLVEYEGKARLDLWLAHVHETCHLWLAALSPVSDLAILVLVNAYNAILDLLGEPTDTWDGTCAARWDIINKCNNLLRRICEETALADELLATALTFAILEDNANRQQAGLCPELALPNFSDSDRIASLEKRSITLQNRTFPGFKMLYNPIKDRVRVLRCQPIERFTRSLAVMVAFLEPIHQFVNPIHQLVNPSKTPSSNDRCGLLCEDLGAVGLIQREVLSTNDSPSLLSWRTVVSETIERAKTNRLVDDLWELSRAEEGNWRTGESPSERAGNPWDIAADIISRTLSGSQMLQVRPSLFVFPMESEGGWFMLMDPVAPCCSPLSLLAPYQLEYYDHLIALEAVRQQLDARVSIRCPFPSIGCRKSVEFGYEDSPGIGCPWLGSGGRHAFLLSRLAGWAQDGRFGKGDWSGSACPFHSVEEVVAHDTWLDSVLGATEYEESSTSVTGCLPSREVPHIGGIPHYEGD